MSKPSDKMITGSGDQSPKIRRRHHKQRSQDHTQKTTAKTAQRTQSKPAKMQSTGLNYQQNVKVLPTIASDKMLHVQK